MAPLPGRILATIVLSQDCDAESIRLLEWSTINDKSWTVKAAAPEPWANAATADAIPTLEQISRIPTEAIDAWRPAQSIRLSRFSQPTNTVDVAHALVRLPRSHSCERPELSETQCSQECEHGTLRACRYRTFATAPFDTKHAENPRVQSVTGKTNQRNARDLYIHARLALRSISAR